MEASIVAWLDADCMIIGDIAELLIPVDGGLQIELRDRAGNEIVTALDVEGAGDEISYIPLKSASAVEIKTAYRKRVKECHPDLFGQQVMNLPRVGRGGQGR